MTIRIGSRKSDLARLQALCVGRALSALSGVDAIEYSFKSSLGDQNQHDPLWQMPEKGVFTQDLTKDLIENKVDLVVHSWKDLPIEDRSLTEIVATLPREDQRDLLLFRKDRCDQLKSPCRLEILSSSPRRAYNLGSFLSWALPGGGHELVFASVRGNVQTRVKKLLESDSASGLVVAKAALDRLLSWQGDEFQETKAFLHRALDKLSWMVLPLKENPTAAGQGALALEIRKGDEKLQRILKSINSHADFINVQKERSILKSYGGGCHQKIGVACLKRDYGNLIGLKGETSGGEVLHQWRLEVPPQIPGEVKGIFPNSMDDARFWQDEDLELSPQLKDSLKGKNLIVAKARAWPESWGPGEAAHLWVAGSRTWRKMAAKGHWVNGSFEGLGEHESPRVDNLLKVSGQKKLSEHQDCTPGPWIKLTHEAAAKHSRDGAAAVGTYRVVPPQGLTEKLPEALKGASHIFWTSFTAFKLATEALPELKARQHACGPGGSLVRLTKALGDEAGGAAPQVFVSYKEWRDLVLRGE